MREKFELLSKISGWTGTLSSSNNSDFSADPENLSKLIDHVVSVFSKKEVICVELNRSLERQQLELDASREQVNLASSRLKELRDRLSGSESQGIELNSKISALTAQLLTLEHALKREKSQSSWSTQELAKVLDSFSNFRKEQSVSMAETRSQADLAMSQASETQQKLEKNVQILKEREKQISDLQETVSSLKSQLMANEANFTREMNSSSRMVELYKNAAEEATERISILQNEIEEMRDVVAQCEAQESGLAADLQAELEERQNVIKIKEEQLEKMRIALDGLLKVAKTKSGNEESLEPVGDNNLDLISEITICKGNLTKAEEECSHLRIMMQEMANESNSRAPLIQSLQIDNSRLKGDVSILTEQLIQVAASRDSALSHRAELERNLAALQAEKESIQQECNDLSQQVQKLLVEIEGGRCDQNGKRLRHSGPSTSDILRASDVITENLVDITSVAQLQQRNQELLKTLRVISSKYEALEKEKESPELRAQLEASLRELDEMHEARKRQAQMVETIIKTNSSGPSTDINKLSISDKLTIELEQIKSQLESKQDTLKNVLVELESVKKDLVAEKVSKAQKAAQLELSEERMKILSETLKNERQESASARERVAVQAEAFNQAQSSSFKLMADLSAAQERESRLHSQIEKLQGEINSLVMETSRLQQEALSATSERDRMASLLGSMKGVLNEHEASEATLKRHFTAQVEFMERELEASRARISEITTLHSSTISALERDRSELYQRLEGLSEELSRRKDLNLRLEGNLTQAQEKLLDLEKVLQQAASESVNEDHNTKTYEIKIRALSSQLKSLQNSLQSATTRVTELEAQLQEMDEIKLKLSSEKEMNENKENELHQVKSELDHLKTDKFRLEEELDSLKQQLKSNEDSIEAFSKNVENLHEEINAQNMKISELETEKSQLAHQLGEAQSSYNSLEASSAIVLHEKAVLTEKIASLEENIQSLKQQNDLLLDEAQNTSSQPELSDYLDGSSSESAVIKFLRGEKDKLQDEKEKLLFDLHQSQLQAEQAQRTLNIEKAAFSAQSADYHRLLEQVQQLNSTRENSALQQHETLQLKMKINLLEAQLNEKNCAILPIKESLENAQSEIDQLKESLTILQSDRDSWKTRFETAISTASASNYPLESELKQVKMQSEMFRQRAIALTKNLQETRVTAQKEIDELNRQVLDLQSKIQVQVSIIESTDDVEMAHEPEPENESEENDENLNSGEPEVIEDLKSSEHEDEEEAEDEEGEESAEESIYEEVSEPASESINESSIVSESIPIDLSEKSSSALTDQSISEPTVIQPVSEPVAPARKKIVSLAGIVGNSSTSNVTAASAAVTTPAMITTASGKKFVPVSFPDPPAATSSGTIPSSGSPSVKQKKNKKPGMMKKKNKASD